jgi:hypothetical protein
MQYLCTSCDFQTIEKKEYVQHLKTHDKNSNTREPLQGITAAALLFFLFIVIMSLTLLDIFINTVALIKKGGWWFFNIIWTILFSMSATTMHWIEGIKHKP